MKETLSKFFQLIKTYQSDIVLAIAVIVVSAISFQSGKIYALKEGEGGITIKSAAPEDLFESPKSRTLSSSQSAGSPQSQVVASKNSTVYHFLWCPGAGKISEKNKITFPTESAAIAAGLTLASNCKK